MYRTPHNYSRVIVSDATGLDCSDEPSLAKQQFKDDSDPNVIMKRFTLTKDPELLNARANANYGDFSGVGSYHESLNRVIEAQEQFMALPSNIRSRFNNDPGQLLDFLDDGRNRDEAIKLGLLKSDLSPSGVRAPRSEREPVGGKSVDAPATTPAKKPSKLKTRLSELLNSSDLTEDE